MADELLDFEDVADPDADLPGVTKRFLTKVYEHIRAGDDLATAIKKARAHAGGVHAQRKRAAAHQAGLGATEDDEPSERAFAPDDAQAGDYTPSASELATVLRAMLADGVIDEGELSELRSWLASLTMDEGEHPLDPLDIDLEDVAPETFAGGNIGPIIAKFGAWAGGSQHTCALKLAGKVRDPNRLCAWLKDRATGTTMWRGKGKGAAAHAEDDAEPEQFYNPNHSAKDGRFVKGGGGSAGAGAGGGHAGGGGGLRQSDPSISDHEKAQAGASGKQDPKYQGTAALLPAGVGGPKALHPAYKEKGPKLDVLRKVTHPELRGKNEAQDANGIVGNAGFSTSWRMRGLSHEKSRAVAEYFLGEGKWAGDTTPLAQKIKDFQNLPHPTSKRHSEGALPEHAIFAPLPQGFADAPEWFHFLPTPGVYTHPRYGKVSITKERNARFVSNFKAGVYQPEIPIDAEHDIKSSGAVAWVKDMRQLPDGSVEARAEWNERGKALMTGDRFKYFSPEIWDSWTNPVTGEVVQDVAVGGAICVRPFFKHGSLRPLVASEGALWAYSEQAGDDEGRPAVVALEAFDVEMEQEPDVADENTQANPQAMTEAQITAKFAELEAARAAAAAEAKVYAEKVEALEGDARRKRFSDMAQGRGGASDGARWYGDIEKHVAFMNTLATTFGEDSDEFKHYVATEQAHAEQLKASGIFSVVGRAGDGSAPGAWERIKAMADELRKADANLTIDAARQRVMEENPQLYTDYEREQGRAQ